MSTDLDPADAVRHEAQLCIPADHPALAGHFPGAPMVPGVLLLDAMLHAAAAWLGEAAAVRALPQVKFLAPLPPGAAATALLERDGERLRFKIEQDGRLLAQGVLTLAASNAAET